MSEIQKMNLASENLVDDRLDKLKELMPEVFTESGIDFDKLRLELGDEVDEGQERYAFTWPGKMDAIRQSQIPSTATLRPCMEKSRGRDGEDGSFDSDNIYIEGDNLEVLKLLQRGYHGKIKMIYIDPPYNTGHDFVYKDKFGDTIENYKEQAGLAGQSNADTSGRYHSDWCSMVYPRLKCARELLADDGVIFISIDDNEAENLKKICNEIFGEENAVTPFIWPLPRGINAGLIARAHEYILVYAKDVNKIKSFNRADGSVEYSIDRCNKKIDSRHPESTIDFPAGVPYEGKDQVLKGKIEGAEQITIIGELEFKDGVLAKPVTLSAGWTMKNMIQDWLAGKEVFDLKGQKIEGFFFKENGKLYSKKEMTTVSIKSILKDMPDTQIARKEIEELFGSQDVFSYPKTLQLPKLFAKLSMNKGDIVLDFFSGSATTAHSIMQANFEDYTNYKYILIQLPEALAVDTEASGLGFSSICDIGEERIRRAGDKIKTELEESNRQLKLGEESKRLPDIGFRVFALDESGIERPEPGQLVLDVVKSDRTELDIVFEMMLKWGLELTLPVEKSDAASYPIWSVACDELVCCMSRGLTIEALEAIADMEPRRVLILDSILDDTLKLNAVQIFKHAGERMGCEIELRTV